MGGMLASRLWEVDLLRGIALIMMILFHFLFDLSYLGVYGLNVFSGFWLHFAQATAAIFLLLVGVSLTLSHSRARKMGVGRLYIRFIKRGLKIFSLGLAVTIITYLLVDGFVIFGVLHLIGISIILAYPFVRLKAASALAGLLFICIGLYLQDLVFDFPWLIWLGFIPHGFHTLDYFPLLPWFGVVLIGIFLGNSLYGDYRRRFYLPDLSGAFPFRQLELLGRNSLLVYMIHQPILITAIYLAHHVIPVPA